MSESNAQRYFHRLSEGIEVGAVPLEAIQQDGKRVLQLRRVAWGLGAFSAILVPIGAAVIIQQTLSPQVRDSGDPTVAAIASETSNDLSENKSLPQSPKRPTNVASLECPRTASQIIASRDQVGPKFRAAVVDPACSVTSLDTGGEDVLSPALSHAGADLVYVRYEGDMAELVLRNVQSGTTRTIYSSPNGLGAPVWSPDDKRIALWRGTATGRSTIDIVDLATGTVIVATSSSEASIAPTWSGSGRWLAWLRLQGSGGKPVIYDTDSGRERELRLAPDRLSHLSWLPGDTQLVGSLDSGRAILLNADDGQPLRVSAVIRGEIRDLGWSDGFVYATVLGGQVNRTHLVYLNENLDMLGQKTQDFGILTLP